jgi:hypothetical protein
VCAAPENNKNVYLNLGLNTILLSGKQIRRLFTKKEHPLLEVYGVEETIQFLLRYVID